MVFSTRRRGFLHPVVGEEVYKQGVTVCVFVCAFVCVFVCVLVCVCVGEFGFE